MTQTRHDAAMNAAYHLLKTIPTLDTSAVATLSMAIAAAVESALSYEPEPVADPLTAALPPQTGVWSCGCSSRECSIRWDTFQSGTPGARVRATCLTHGLVARTVTDPDEGHSLTHARARAMAQLDAAHGEQCR